jgi:succinyl-CoA synthetase beta subunit
LRLQPESGLPGVKVVNSKEEIRAFAENWLGKRLVTYQTDANGQPAFS